MTTPEPIGLFDLESTTAKATRDANALVDRLQARAKQERGMRLAESTSEPARAVWARDCDRGILELAGRREPFTANDLASVGVQDPPESSWVGPRFNAAARAGVIKQVGAQRSSRPQGRGCLVRVWIGTAP